MYVAGGRGDDGEGTQAGAMFKERRQTELAFADLFQDCARSRAKRRATGVVSFEECIEEEEDAGYSSVDSDEDAELRQHGLIPAWPQ